MNLPQFITFTGVDSHTPPDELVMLENDYPERIEWGFLLSPKRQGLEPRYPELVDVEWMLEELGLLRAAAHLCGQDARDVIAGRPSRHHALIRDYFDRVQINTTTPVDTAGMASWAECFGVEAILQCRASFPDDSRVSWLFDKSGGRGEEQNIWPQPPLGERLVGYAGGLNPANVADKIRSMVAGSPTARYWIDMETGVRDANDRFSVAKCRAVCEAIYGDPQ